MPQDLFVSEDTVSLFDGEERLWIAPEVASRGDGLLDYPMPASPLGAEVNLHPETDADPYGVFGHAAGTKTLRLADDQSMKAGVLHSELLNPTAVLTAKTSNSFSILPT